MDGGPQDARSPAGITDDPGLDDLIEETIRVWQPFSPDPLTPEDAREILLNVTTYFDMLLRWASEDSERTQRRRDRAA